MPPRKTIAVFSLLALMEALAGFALLLGVSLTDFTSPGDAVFWLLLLTACLGAIVSLAIAAAGPRAPWNRVILLGAGAVVIGVPSAATARAVSSFLASTVLLGLAFWRGVAVTGEPPDHEEVQRRFGTGLTILFFGLIWLVARGVIDQRHVWQLFAVLGVSFTLASLLALVTVRLETSGAPGASQAALLSAGLQIGFISLVGLTSLVVFSHDATDSLFRLTRPAWDLLGPAWYRLLAAVFSPLGWLIDHLKTQARPPHTIQRPFNPASPIGTPKRHRPEVLSSGWALWVGVVFVTVPLVAIATLIWRSLPRLTRWRGNPGYREVRQSIWSFREARQALLMWLRSLFGKSGEIAVQATNATRRRLLGPAYSPDPVRKLYGRLLYRAQTAGVPRELSSTPAEFELRLTRNWPQGANDFRALTEAYVYRRYDERNFEESEVSALRDSWQRARRVMKSKPQALGPPDRIDQGATLPGMALAPSAQSTASSGAKHWTQTLLDLKPVAALRHSTLLRTMTVEIVGACVAVAVLVAFLLAVIVFGLNLGK